MFISLQQIEWPVRAGHISVLFIISSSVPDWYGWDFSFPEHIISQVLLIHSIWIGVRYADILFQATNTNLPNHSIRHLWFLQGLLTLITFLPSVTSISAFKAQKVEEKQQQIDKKGRKKPNKCRAPEFENSFSRSVQLLQMMKAKNDPSDTCHCKKSFSEPNITANGGREIGKSIGTYSIRLEVLGRVGTGKMSGLGSKDPECGVSEGKRRENCKKGQLLAGQIRWNEKLHLSVKRDDPGRASAALTRGWAETDDEWRKLKARSIAKSTSGNQGFVNVMWLCAYIMIKTWHIWGAANRSSTGENRKIDKSGPREGGCSSSFQQKQLPLAKATTLGTRKFQLKVCVSFAHLLTLLHDQDGLGYASFKYTTTAISSKLQPPHCSMRQCSAWFSYLLTHPFFPMGLRFCTTSFNRSTGPISSGNFSPPFWNIYCSWLVAYNTW